MTRRQEPTGPNESRDTATGLGGYPAEAGNATLLGVSLRGTPIYHDAEENRRLEGYRETTDGTEDWQNEVAHDEDATVGDVIDEVEETIGWDKLTDFAEEHVPSVGDDGDDDTPNGGENDGTSNVHDDGTSNTGDPTDPGIGTADADRPDQSDR